MFYKKGSETLQTRQQLANQVASQIKEAADADAAKAQAEGTITDPVGSSNNPSNAIFTVANGITFCRLILTIIFLVLFSTGGNRWVERKPSAGLAKSWILSWTESFLSLAFLAS